MRLVSFELPTPLGPHDTGRGGVARWPVRRPATGLSRACLAGKGTASKEGAARLAAASLPTDMVALIENGAFGLDAARAALDWVSANGDAGIDGARLVHEPGSVRLLAPIPRPPLIRDFMAFEQHLKNIYPKLGREIPPQWYELPVYYKGNPSAVGADGDVIAMPSYATTLDFEFEFAAVIGQGGIDIQPGDAMRHVYGYMIYNDFSGARNSAARDGGRPRAGQGQRLFESARLRSLARHRR